LKDPSVSCGELRHSYAQQCQNLELVVSACIHREKLKHNKDFIAQVIEKFGQDNRRLVFLFDKKEED